MNYLTAKQKKAIIGAVVAIVLAVIGGTATAGPTLQAKKKKTYPPRTIPSTISIDPVKTYPVTRVVDGDTFDVDVDGQSLTVRMLGINTPETVDPRRPVQCFGKEASNKAKEILMPHAAGTSTRVHLETDPTQDAVDRYDRLLAYVTTEDGLFFNKYMLEQGYAYEYTYDKPYRYQKEFKQAQVDAQTAHRGLWNDAVCPVKK